jgi:hypothetical protein
MDQMLDAGELAAAVTMHYTFPIGISTVGRVVTPALGRSMYIANTTGVSDTERVSAMLKNTVAALAVAKACGNEDPTVGILNVEGARQLERELTALRDNGYPLRFAASGRADGGAVMRGNDLLRGAPDIMVMDSLTGNVVVKLLSAFSSGGNYEALGDGYGPGAGEGCRRIVNIISRASGAPVVAGALSYAGACARGGLPGRVAREFALARAAGLDKALAALAAQAHSASGGEAGAGAAAVTQPPAKVVTEELHGIEILALEDAQTALWRAGIYATSGMGCTGPVLMVAAEDRERAAAQLRTDGFL